MNKVYNITIRQANLAEMDISFGGMGESILECTEMKFDSITRP